MTPIPPTLNGVISRALDSTALTEKDLVDDLLDITIQFCDSAQLPQHARTFHGHSRLIACLSIMVDKLHTLSTTPDLSEIASLQYVLPPVQLVFSAIGLFLAVAKSDAANCDALVDLFDYVDNILERPKIYPDPEITVTPEMTRTLVKIMIELMSVFAIATKQVKEDAFRKYARKLVEENNMDKVFLGLDRLTPEEAWRTVMPTLEVIHGLVNNLTFVMEGDSSTSSTIIHDPLLMGDTGLATVGYFYVDFRELAKQNMHGLLSPLLAQLCAQSDRFCDALSSLYATNHRGLEQPSENELAKCLRDMLKDRQRAPIFTVVGTLDECPISRGILAPRAQVLEIVEKVIRLNLKPPHIQFCITCPLDIDIRQGLNPPEPYSLLLHDQEQLEDIAQYVRSVVISDVTMQEWSREVEKLVIDTLAKNGGMFRVAFCQLETLRHCPSQEISSTLTALPRMSEETYGHILQRIDPEKWEYACHIFRFLTVPARPLYVQELAEIFTIRAVGETTGIPDFNPRWRQQDAESAVLSARSSSIPVVKVGEQVVQLSHVLEFLTSTRLQEQCSTCPSQYYMLPRSAHTLVAKACLSVLLRLNPRIHRNSVKRMFPLATYAAKHWVSHAQLGGISSLIDDGMDRLFDKDKPHFAAWIWVYNIDNPSGPHMGSTTPEIPETAPLYYAALCGFLVMVKRLVESHPEDVDTRGHGGGTPLHAALRNCHSDVALLLLEHNADPNSRDSRDETPLQIVSRQGDTEAIQSLLGRGANLEAKDKNNETSLSLASGKGNLEAARLLLKHGAGVDQRVVLGRTALHVAVEHGHYSIVDLLLNNGANVDAQDRHRRTPLHLAADQGDAHIARLLLQRGANADARDLSQLTPLHKASSGGQAAAVQLLLDYNTDVNADDEEGWTALHLAAYNGYLDVGELLIAHGAICDSKNHDGNTPLHIALANHHTKIAELLVASQQESPKGLKRGYQEEHTLIISVG